MGTWNWLEKGEKDAIITVTIIITEVAPNVMMIQPATQVAKTHEMVPGKG